MHPHVPHISGAPRNLLRGMESERRSRHCRAAAAPSSEEEKAVRRGIWTSPESRSRDRSGTGNASALGAVSATQVVVFASIAYAILQTISFSLYLYSAELYPTRLRAIGTGFGSAWLRAGSAIGPILVGWIVDNYGISLVFTVFAAVALIGGLITIFFAVETKGQVLEELLP
ncbi:MFS transporter [Arthrobacter sp. MMS24-T111]